MKHVVLKGVAFCLMLLVLASAFAACGGSGEETVTINVYNWGQYIADGSDGSIDVNALFTEKTGIKVNYMTYDSNETMYTKLKTGGSSYDVIIPSDYMIGRLINEGLVQKINFDNIPNYSYVDEAYQNTSYDPENAYSVPYTWGTVGVIYNKKYVDEADIGSWKLLWNEKYAGKILMFDNNRDAFAVAQSILGYSANTEDPEELQACTDLLLEQKPLVQSYVMDQVFDKMEREEAYIAPYYAGDYLTMVEENPDLGFFFPQEGFNLYIDACCIPTSATNVEAAEAYINFLLDPEICGQNLEYLGYSAPETEAKAYMDSSVADSEIAYPDAETLENGFIYSTLSTEASQLMDSLWLTVKTDNGSNSWKIIVGAAVVVVLILLLVLIQIRRKKKRAAMRAD